MLLNKIRIFAEMVKFEHTVFALPFAYIAVFLARNAIILDAAFFWITMAMIGARTAAMALNRMIDRMIDSRNPRTSNRALPRGTISLNEVRSYTLLSVLLFFLAAYQLSPLAFALAPVCLLAFVFYSYTKRFTWLSHVALGLTIGLAPLAAWIAVTGSIAPGAILLSLGVACWVAGFDVMYACDDFEYDRREGLFSIPARFGIAAALQTAAAFHAGATLFFALTGAILGLGPSYWLGLVLAVLLMYQQHALLSPHNLGKLKFAFFQLNGTLSITMLLATLIEVSLR